MLIWLPIALLTGVAVLAVLLPLGSRRVVHDTGGDVAFYRARVREIEGDAARGLIEPQDAEAAKIEAARFLLAAERMAPEEREGAFSLGRRRGAASTGPSHPPRPGFAEPRRTTRPIYHPATPR